MSPFSLKLKKPLRALRLGAAVLCGVLVSACSMGSAARGPSDCRPSDSSMTCCIKKFPANPVDACAATAADLEEARRAGAAADTFVPMSLEEADDFANNRDLPEWKQNCIKLYVRCQEERWTGRCDACLRACEGQHRWPFKTCEPRE